MTDANMDGGILGIDAGGTFTDLAFISGLDSTVEACGKTPTCHENLLHTIESGVKIILANIAPSRIKGVNLATTLATNAIVENKLRPTGLILIGYDAAQVESAIKLNRFGTKKVLMIAGGHDPKGNEVAPLEEKTLYENLDSMISEVESIAVSGYFSVRNPKHEVRVREIIRQKSPSTYVTCGHELASDLDAILRATTAALNAGLIPIVMDLFGSVQKIFSRYGINVPISIVRSDGSLVSVEWANEHPIETVLSGPAASSIGACHLAHAIEFHRPTWVVDVGGTTTDIIYIDENGKPGLGTEGTTVGGHKTLIKSIDIYTFGLGGDSRVRFDKDMKLLVGPRRVKSLCSTADEISGVASALEHLKIRGTQAEPLILRSGINKRVESEFEKRVVKMAETGFTTPDAVLESEQTSSMSFMKMQEMQEMEDKGLLCYSGFTPTDALHVLGKLNKWNKDASVKGAEILSKGLFDTLQLSRNVCNEVVRKIALNVLKKSFMRVHLAPAKAEEFESFINLGLVEKMPPGSAKVIFKLGAALVGVGAPTWAFIHEVGSLVGEKAYLPKNAEVAGAVGAAVGAFSLRYSVWVSPLPNGSYRVHLPSGIEDYPSLKSAVDQAVNYMTPWIEERARKSGALDPVVSYKQEDEEAWVQGGLRKMHLWTQVWFDVTDASRHK